MQNEEWDFPPNRRPRVAQIQIEDAGEFRDTKPNAQYQTPLQYRVLDAYAKGVFFTAKMALAAVCGVVFALCVAFIVALAQS